MTTRRLGFNLATTLYLVLGSLAKPVWGGLRVGWIRAARPVI